jgi:L-alanine-DL-glutamate epimerase-like enolase superfamily enzyme
MTDMMLFDLVSKKAGVPLYKYLGAFRNSIPTSITIPILNLEESLKRAGEYLKRGFKYIKIKGGLNVDEDIEKFIKIRERCGKQIFLLFDANQGYTIKDTVKFAQETLSLNVELIEQPTPRDKPEMLGEIKALINIPVMADESLMNLADAYNLATNNYCDMINIKLMKVGGISEALTINSIAKAAGMKCMVGCMDESELSISASLHFALSRPNIYYTDLDGHLDLINDPASGAFTVREGILWPDSSPGLGIDKLKF